MNTVTPDEVVEVIAARLDRFELVQEDVVWEIVTRDGACMVLSRLDREPAWTRDELRDRELAARICAHCPVRWECLELQLRTSGEHTIGVWGALPAEDVRALYPVWQSRRHRHAGRRGDLQGVTVAMGVRAHHGIHDIGQHRHSVARLLPAQGSRTQSAPVWAWATERHFCDESREHTHGQASDQASRWRRTAPATEKTSHDQGTPHTRYGQNTCESSSITGPHPARGPNRNRRTTHSQNTWASYADGSPSRIVLHSVPPLLVFVAAEAVTDLRDKLTDAVTAAVRATDGRTASSGTTSVHGVHGAAAEGRPVRRRTFEEYRQVARRAWSPDVEITPRWVRQVTGCSQGLSSRLARALAGDVEAVNGAPDGGGRP